jgi:hypothetical protein
MMYGTAEEIKITRAWRMVIAVDRPRVGLCYSKGEYERVLGTSASDGSCPASLEWRPDR